MRKAFFLTLLFGLACGTAETAPSQSDGRAEAAAGAGGDSAGSGGGLVDGVDAAGAGMSGGSGASAAEDGAPHDATGQPSGDAWIEANGQDVGAPRDASTSDAHDAPAVQVTTEGAREGGSFACGAQTCGADEWCQYPCCGNLPACMASTNDSGQCAVGFASCPLGDGATGCRYTCSVPSCTKAPTTVGCTVNGRTVRCTCA